MQFDAVETRFARLRRGMGEILDNLADLFDLERTRLSMRLETRFGERLACGHNGRRRHRLHSAGLQGRMRDPSNVPELDDDPSAFVVHRLCDGTPSCNLV